jgi:hypothetical protein
LYSHIPAGVHGPACIFWANLTPFTLKAELAALLVREQGKPMPAAEAEARPPGFYQWPLAWLPVC